MSAVSFDPSGMAGDPVTVEDHQARVIDLLGVMPVVERPLAECLGLVLARDLVSDIALPPFDNSAMDGYAVRSQDVVGASRATPVELPVVEDIPAGRTDVVALRPGAAHRIMTGAPLPPGADAVVRVELTDAGTQRVLVSAEVAPGTYVRRAGEDVTPGTPVLAARTPLGPAQLGLAAAIGAATLPVCRRPRVLVLSTGSELVPPGRPLRAGQIYESNSVLLATAARTAGAEAEILRFVPDDVAAFQAAIAGALDRADLLITSGGVSAGAYEVVKDALAGHGVRFVKVAMQPGGPQGAGRYQGVPVVTLPGNPVSAAISFEVFVRPALRAAMGHRQVRHAGVTAALTESLVSPAGLRQYRRGRYDPLSAAVSLVGGPGSHLLAALAAANCLVVVPEEVTTLVEGSEVTVLPLDNLTE